MTYVILIGGYVGGFLVTGIGLSFIAYGYVHPALGCILQGVGGLMLGYVLHRTMGKPATRDRTSSPEAEPADRAHDHSLVGA